MTVWTRLSLFVVTLLLTASVSRPVLLGQTTGGSISGEVRDTSGAVIPGASLTVTNVETGATRTATADSTGRYRVQNLAVGSYQVEATYSGFKSVTRRGITLTVGRAADVDITMDVGNVTEIVEVTGEAPLVDTTTAVLGGLVDQKSIQDLPLNGRSFLELATLQAGTINAVTGGRSESQGYGQKVSISGGRFTSNVFLIDGTVMNDSFNSAGGVADGVAAGVESVREFKVITNSYSAEYGQHTGGVVNAVTKGGTNDFHGSVYEFLRNDNLDTFRWEDKARIPLVNEPTKPEFRRNQFGFSLGGPVVRDRTFFFGNFEALREAIGDNQIISIPDQNMRLGLLPASETEDSSDSGLVDVAAQDPAAFAKVKPFFDKFWPIPSGVTLSPQADGTLDYVRAVSEPTKLNYTTVRVDHKLSDNDSIFGRYTIDHADRLDVEAVNVFSNGRTRNQFATFQYDRIVSPTVLNSANIGFSRNWTGVVGSSLEGFERVTFAESEFGHGVVSIPGISGTGSGILDPRIFILNNYQAKDDLTINRGNHTFKIGANFSRLQHNDTSPRQPAGTFDFDSKEAFLLADPEEALISLAENFVRHVRQSIVGAYFQDDWRLFPNFTLNWGVRYEMTTSPSFAADLAGSMPRALEEKFFAVDAEGNNLFGPSDVVLTDTLFENPSKNNFAPRVGFAWDVLGDGKTSLRGGAGIFSEALLYWTYRLAILHTAPLFVEGRLTRGTTPGGVDFPNAYFTQREIFLGDPRYESFQAKPNQPYVGKFSLEIQRQLAPTVLARVGYSGSRGVHLPNRAEQNGRRSEILPDGRLFYQFPGPVVNTNFGRTRHRRTNGSSIYHSMRLEIEKRLSAGLQLQGNYTWSKNIDDGTSVTGGTDFSNDPNPPHFSIPKRGLAATDVRHVFTINSTYDLPGPSAAGWMNQVLGGWSLNTLVRLSAGQPIGIQTGFDYARQIQGGRYLDQVEGATNNPIEGTSAGCTLQTSSRFRYGNTTALPAGAELGTPDLYYDPCVFLLPQPRGVIGSMGRNTVIGPGIRNIDFSLGKSFDLSMLREGTRVDFRGELFNLFNTPNFANPGSGVFVAASANTRRPSGTAGLINSTSGNPRKIQLGLKVIF